MAAAKVNKKTHLNLFIFHLSINGKGIRNRFKPQPPARIGGARGLKMKQVQAGSFKKRGFGNIIIDPMAGTVRA